MGASCAVVAFGRDAVIPGALAAVPLGDGVGVVWVV